MIFQIEIFNFNPVRVIDADRYVWQAGPECVGERQSFFDEVQNVFVSDKLARGG